MVVKRSDYFQSPDVLISDEASETCAAVSIYFNSSVFTDAAAVLLSLLIGCLVWSSPIVTDDISLQFMTVGVFAVKLDTWGDWAPAILFPAVKSARELFIGGREDKLAVVLSSLLCLLVGLWLVFAVLEQWSVVIFIILDSFIVFQLCSSPVWT